MNCLLRISALLKYVCYSLESQNSLSDVKFLNAYMNLLSAVKVVNNVYELIIELISACISHTHVYINTCIYEGRSRNTRKSTAIDLSVPQRLQVHISRKTDSCKLVMLEIIEFYTAISKLRLLRLRSSMRGKSERVFFKDNRILLS